MKKWLINAKRLIKETFKWFIKGWFIYLPIILFVFTFFLESEKAIARYGTALQIIAAITIGAGLSSRFILFEGKSLLQIPKEYFSKFPLTRKRENVVIGFKGDELKTKEGEIKIVAYLNEQSFKDIPEVVKYFHEHIQALHTSIKNERKGLEKRINNVYNNLSTSQRENGNEIKELKSIMHKISVSSISLEIFGLFCLIMGLFISAWPNIF